MKRHYHEEQRFRQRWLWMLLLLGVLATAGLFGYGMLQQLLLGHSWGDRPMSDTALALTGSGLLLFELALLWLFYSLCLVTELRPDGLHLHLRPLYRKHIPCQRIRSCIARTYRPLAEYGGWGIKYGRSGWAYNVSGNRGVQLVLDDGKRILVGSQQADKLAKALQQQCGLSADGGESR